MNAASTQAAYVLEMGHEPPVDESEGAWQWDYRGTPAEREGLLERLREPDELPEPAAEQAALW